MNTDTTELAMRLSVEVVDLRRSLEGFEGMQIAVSKILRVCDGTMPDGKKLRLIREIAERSLAAASDK